MTSSIMELQEDAYRVQQVLENVDIKDIIKFMRTKVALHDTEVRCQLALQHFLNLEDDAAKQDETYDGHIRTDLLCIRHLLKSVPDEEITELLNVLGPIPNRKYVAVKLLLRDHPRTCRKKRKNNCDKQSDIGEASSSKVVKVSELNEPFILMENMDSDEAAVKKEIPKLTIKSVKDRNGNDKFMVTSPVKNRSEPDSDQSELEEVSTTTSEIINISDDDISKTPSKPPLKMRGVPAKHKESIKPSRSKTEPYKLPSTSTATTTRFKMKPAVFHPHATVTTSQNTDSSHPPSTSTSSQSNGLSRSPSSRSPSSPSPSSSSSSQSNGLSPQPSTNNAFQEQAGPSSLPGPSKLAEAKSTTLVKEENLIPFPFKLPGLPTQEEVNPTPQLVQPNEVLVLNEDLNPSGPSKVQEPKIVDEKLVLKLLEVLPHVTSEYIRDVCAGKTWSEQNYDEIIDVILTAKDVPIRPIRSPSPAKDVDLEEQLTTLKELLPDADPSYLHEKLDQFAGDPDALWRFVEDAMETKGYPTLKEYLRKQQLSAQQRQYTTEFNVERFVELFPDPVGTFEDPNRKTTILDPSDKYYVKWFMRNKYNQLYAKDVNSIVETEGTKNIVSIVKGLNACVAKGAIKKTRWVAHYSRPDTQNIPLLQELAYFDHIDKIYTHIECKKTQDAEERKNAKELGLLQTCSCCYDEEVMPNDILTCCGGCRFCRDCIKKGTEVAFGEGKVTFPCMMDCGAEFSLQVLQNVLPPKVFSKLAQKKAVAEVKAAGVEDLETCPFCDFATIPVPEDKLFRCLNPDCMKESCRLCKEPSHVPLRCDEVEKDQDIKARTYIEDKMTEALIRQCWKCNAKFIKEEGCNKMTCSCGAIMCYVCRKPVKDYKHFNGQGGDRIDLCPLYTDNFSVNEKNVLEAAEEAKKQIDPAKLKNDPTADLQKHFGDKIKEAERRANLIAARAPAHGHLLPPLAGRAQEVERLRNELRDQLRAVQHLNIDHHNILDMVEPRLNQALDQINQPRYLAHIPAYQPRPAPQQVAQAQQVRQAQRAPQQLAQAQRAPQQVAQAQRAPQQVAQAQRAPQQVAQAQRAPQLVAQAQREPYLQVRAGLQAYADRYLDRDLDLNPPVAPRNNLVAEFGRFLAPPAPNYGPQRRDI